MLEMKLLQIEKVHSNDNAWFGYVDQDITERETWSLQ